LLVIGLLTHTGRDVGHAKELGSFELVRDRLVDLVLLFLRCPVEDDADRPRALPNLFEGVARVKLHLAAPRHFSLEHLFGEVDARRGDFRGGPLSHVGVDHG
jgi:hypothetical protein